MMANINRDYLISVDVKKSTIINKNAMTFYITDENTCNFFVNLVINLSDNELISKYANIENAEDYTLECRIVKPNNDFKVIEGKLLDKERALYEFDLPRDCRDFVGTYRCELLTKCIINKRDEITTSSPFKFKVEKSILNDLEEVEDAQGKPIIDRIVEELDSKVDKEEGKTLTSNDLTNTLKFRYDTAYTHSQSTHAPTNAQKNSDITKSEIEAKLTGNITTHTHSQYAPTNNPRFTGTHTEGYDTTANGENSHAEGVYSKANRYASHAEGVGTISQGEGSHSEGGYTVANSNYQHVEGYYNIEDNNNKYVHIVGNGNNVKRSNAHTLDWEGNAWYQGNVSVNGTPTNDNDLTTKKYVDEAINNAQISGGNSGSGIELHSHDNKDVLDNITQDKVNEWNNKSDFDGDYNSLTNKPIIPSIDGLASETYVNTKVSELVDSAPETLDTLNELATALGDDPNFATTIATQIGSKVDKVEGKGLSTNDLTDTLKSNYNSAYTHSQSAHAPSNAEANVQVDWNVTDINSDAYIKNKPTVPTKVSQLTNDSGFITNIPSEYITETELNEKGYATEDYVTETVNNASISGGYTHPDTHPASMITGLSTVATSGSYNDLTDKPTIPSEYTLPTASATQLGGIKVGDGLSITNGVLSATGGGTADSVDWSNVQNRPTALSQFTNDSGFISSIPSEYITETELNAKGYLTQHQDLSDYAKKDTLTTVRVSSNALALTSDKYQYAEITGDTTIALPSVSGFTEIHLFFDLYSDFAGAITLSSTVKIRYQQKLEFTASNGYELILTHVPTMGWLVGLVKYEGEGNSGSTGDIGTPTPLG